MANIAVPSTSMAEELTRAARWAALERAVQLAGLSKSVCDEFMFMCQQGATYQYKHCDTRNYAMLRGTESAADCAMALAHARSMAERWPDRPRMAWEVERVIG